MKITWAISVLIISLLTPLTALSGPCTQQIQNILHDSYPLSIAILASAQCDDLDGYKKIRGSFIATLPKGLLTGQNQPDQNTPFNLWLLGRLAFADSLQKHPEQAVVANTLKNALQINSIDSSSDADLGDDTAMHLWGYAYAIAANPELYHGTLNIHDLKGKTFLALQNQHLLPTNKGWIITMDLLAASAIKDPELYTFSKNLIMDKKVIDDIPLSDYRNWAWAMVRQAALQMHDAMLFDMATTQYQLTKTALQNTPVKNPQTQNLMMLIGTTSFDYTTRMMPKGVPAATIVEPVMAVGAKPAETPMLMPADLEK